MNRAVSCWLVFAVCWGSSLAFGQGLLIAPDHPFPLPRPIWPTPVPPAPVSPDSYRIKTLAVSATVTHSAARVQVSQTFVNTGSRAMQVQFVFPLPHDAAIDELTLLVEGKEFPAKLLPAEEARKAYEAIVRSSKDPALLEWMGTGLYRTNVFPVPAGAERTVSLQYHQLLRTEGGLTEFLFPLATAKYTSQPVESMTFRLTLEAAADLQTIYSPTHDIQTDRPDARHAVVSWKVSQQVPRTDFRLFFQETTDLFSAQVLSYRPTADEPGYFLALATPSVGTGAETTTPLPKRVVFVVDRSGSMTGAKIQQAKDALKFILQNLREGDQFNLVAYDSAVESFRPELVLSTLENRQAALGFVAGINASGGTNIQEALTVALGYFKDSTTPSYVFFLTDGLPTVGEKSELKIAATVRQANRFRTRILSFGVGYDVNSRLLDRLSRDNFGTTEYVRPEEEIEQHVSRVFGRMASPVLTDVKLEARQAGQKPEAGPIIQQVQPRQLPDLFAGEQMVVLGRYPQSGSTTFQLTGRVGERAQKYEFVGELASAGENASRSFIAKLWALRRIGEILDELDLKGKNPELVAELVQLATKHGIVTPYTSYLADETATRTDLQLGVRLQQTTDRLGLLEAEGGMLGFEQRAAKADFQSARQLNAVPNGGGLGGYGGMPASGRPALVASPTAGGVVAAPVQAPKQDGIRWAGDVPLFRRGQFLVSAETAEIDLEKDRAKIQQLERFSPEYFQLVAKNTEQENLLLSQQGADEELLVVIRGQVYWVK